MNRTHIITVGPTRTMYLKMLNGLQLIPIAIAMVPHHPKTKLLAGQSFWQILEMRISLAVSAILNLLYQPKKYFEVSKILTVLLSFFKIYSNR